MEVPHVATSYELWVSQWINHLTGTPLYQVIPSSSGKINTPLILNSRLTPSAASKSTVGTALPGGYFWRFQNWVLIYCARNPKSSKKNLQTAFLHPQVVDKYIKTELWMHKMVGSYLPNKYPLLLISRFVVIPKHHQVDKWLVIVDVSHPDDYSINYGIASHLCSVWYITVYDTIQEILTGTLLAKVDIKNAFYLLPVHPADRSLLGMK